MFKNTQTIVWVIICLLRDNLPYTPKRTKSLKLLHLLLTDHLIICLVISLLCLSLHLHMPDIQTRYPFSIHLWYHYIFYESNTCKTGITNGILITSFLQTVQKNIPSSFFYNFSSIFTTYHHFLNIYPQKLQHQSSFPSL